MQHFDTNIPIYIQVVESIKMQIMNGTLRPGDKIASVRELAQDLSVNPNTVQKAFAELERQGFIRTERAVGRYVAENQELIDECKEQVVKEKTKVFVEQMELLGLSIKDVIDYLKSEEKYDGNIDSNTGTK